MKRGLVVLAVLGWVGVASLAKAEDPLIRCIGTESGGTGPRQYAYEVDAAGFPVIELRVGTCSLDPAEYTSVLMPEGWEFAVERVPGPHAHHTKTAHGEISLGPCYCLTNGSVHWWTEDPALAVESFTFGYDNPRRSEDVFWTLGVYSEEPPNIDTFSEDWGSPVGMGTGLIHGPAPEPGSLVLLVSGGLCLVVRRWRRRCHR